MIAFILVITIYCYLARYEIVAAGSGGSNNYVGKIIVFKIDKFTGKTWNSIVVRGNAYYWKLVEEEQEYLQRKESEKMTEEELEEARKRIGEIIKGKRK